MKKILLVILILALVSGCKNKEMKEKINYQNIDVDQVYEAVENSDYTIIDVRTESEYKHESIPGAILITLDGLKNKIEEKIPDKNTNIIVYCQSGNRSQQASEILVSLGYTNVYNMKGGILAYPYETVKE